MKSRNFSSLPADAKTPVCVQRGAGQRGAPEGPSEVARAGYLRGSKGHTADREGESRFARSSEGQRSGQKAAASSVPLPHPEQP